MGIGDTDLYALDERLRSSLTDYYRVSNVENIRKMKKILASKNVPAWIDIWGEEVNHDWDWWRRQMPYFLDKYFFKFSYV